MRILQVSGTYPPLIGGLEKAVETYADSLAARDHEVEVVTLSHGDTLTGGSHSSVPVHRVKGWNRALARAYQTPGRQLAPPVPDPGVVRALRVILARFRPDFVHVHDWMAASVAAALRPTGVPLVLSLHDHGLVCIKRTFLRDHAMCDGPGPMKCVVCGRAQYGLPVATALKGALGVADPLLDRVDLFLPVSHAVQRIATDHSNKEPSRFRVVAAPIPDQVGEETQRPCPEFLRGKSAFILFVGALGRHKGVDVLLRAHAQLENPPELVLLGTRQTDTPEVLSAAVTVVEDVPYPQVLAAYERAQFVVVPSVWPEPLATVPREAMLRGCPVIASRAGGLSEIIEDGASGLLVTAGDAIELATAMQVMIDRPDLRSRLAAQARSSAQRYLARYVAGDLEAAYDEARRRRRRKEKVRT